MKFSKQSSTNIYPKIKLDGILLKWSSHAKHLGITLASDLSETKEIMNKKGDFIGRVNTIMANVPCAPDDIILPLFRSQCCHHYGCQAWDLSDSKTKDYYTTWNRAVRRLLNLPIQTHRRYLPRLAKMPNAESQVFSRFVKQIKTMCGNRNKLVCYVGYMGTRNADTIIGRSLHHICETTRTPMKTVFQCRDFTRYELCCSIDDLCVIKAITDLRDNLVKDFNNMQLIHFLCTS